MALVVLSSLVNDIRGSVNGSTFGQSVGGLVLRNKITKRGSSSPAQKNTQLLTAQVANAWNQLSTTNKNNWQAWANFNPIKNRRLQNRIVNGKSAHFRTNWYQKAALGVFQTTPVFSIPNTIVQDMTVKNTAGVLTLDNITDDPAATYKYYIVMSRAHSGIKTKTPTVLKNITPDGYTGSKATITNGYTAAFQGLPATGQTIYVRVIQVFPDFAQTPTVIDRYITVG